MDWSSSYHQIMINLKKQIQKGLQYQLGDICLDCHAFSIENIPPTYQRAITLAFKDYFVSWNCFGWF